MKILKFGGSSVATPERIKNVVKILKNYHAKGEKFAVVFSAFGGVTDSLIEMSRQAESGDLAYKTAFETFKSRHRQAITTLLTGDFYTATSKVVEEGFQELENLLTGIQLIKEASQRTMDYVLSFGERNSAYIIAKTLTQAGLDSAYLDARKVIRTNDNFGSAKVDFQQTNALIQQYFKENHEIQVITGFIGRTKNDLTTTLGRGGSDYTTAIFAAALEATLIEIWTDVDGVMTADPRKVKQAFTMNSMTYAEAMEMSHFGAKVIYPPTLQPALLKHIPLRIKNTFNPSFKGTLISDFKEKSDRPVKGISSIGNISLVTLEGSGLIGVPGIAARLFGTLARHYINIILITQSSSEHSITFGVLPQLAEKAKICIEEEFRFELQSKTINAPKIEKNLCVIAAIGENMRYRSGISGRMFQALGSNGINIVAIAQGSSELNISAVIKKVDQIKALNALHEAFFLSDAKVLHLFIVGVGLIGGTLLKQIKNHTNHLQQKRQLEIKVVGLANSKKMLFDEKGLDLSDWKTQLLAAPDAMDIAKFIAKMKALNLRNSIFVDNTAHQKVAREYASILAASISVSTPNKLATSSKYQQYQLLKNLAVQNGVKFLYETNVGAGLPVLTTLDNLMSSGDRILKIEGILSGSLSFIFNSFKKGVRFSDIVKQAQQLGYTEPDPRDDLNGMDVRRKLLILARESGLPMEAEDIMVENILPQACIEAPTVPAFFEALEANDAHFDALQQKANAEGKVLRFIATLEAIKGSVALKMVDEAHPFYSLSGSDNMIVFTTERYRERPLVVRGPGAGAEVTAAGVFAEIISIGNYLT